MIFTQPGSDFDEFVVQASPSLLRLAFRLTADRHAAEDLLQTALIRVSRRWRQAADNPWAYTRTVMVRLATDSWRLKKRRVQETFSLHESSAFTSSDTAQSHVEHRDELLWALRRLPPRMRTVLVLRYWEDLTVQETADFMGCSSGTVKSTSSRAIEQLRHLLSAEEYSNDRS